MIAAVLVLLSLAVPRIVAPVDSCREAGPTAARSLATGESVSRQIDSQNERNHTGILLDSGVTYRLLARGMWQDGKWIAPHSGRGYPLSDVPWYSRPLMWLAQPIRRAPDAPWFALVGEISSKPREFFVIGDSLSAWRSPATGELIAFANDVKHKYGNNIGCITLTVERVR